jgi:hypothetical protein
MACCYWPRLQIGGDREHQVSPVRGRSHSEYCTLFLYFSAYKFTVHSWFIHGWVYGTCLRFRGLQGCALVYYCYICALAGMHRCNGHISSLQTRLFSCYRFYQSTAIIILSPAQLTLRFLFLYLTTGIYTCYILYCILEFCLCPVWKCDSRDFTINIIKPCTTNILFPI